MKKLLILLLIGFISIVEAQKIKYGNFSPQLKADLKDTTGSIVSDSLNYNTIQVINVNKYGISILAIDNSSAIQSAIDAAVAGDNIYIPFGIYSVKDTIEIDADSSLTIIGDGKYATTIKLDTANVSSGWPIFYIHDSDKITFRNIGFSAIDYYPVDDTLQSRDDVDSLTIGIRIVNSSNVKIEDCYFNGFTYSSIQLTADANDNNCNDITIQNSVFNKGAWKFKTIAAYGADGVDLQYDNTDLFNVKALNNKIYRFGVQKILYPGTEDAFSGAGIHFDNLRNSAIVGNLIDSCSALGIRLEQSERCAVTHNIINEAGSAGMIIYGDAYDNTIIGNIITGFGRIPDNRKLVEYGGQYYNPVVYMGGAFPLPNNPTVADSGFEVYKYVITGETDSIPTYDSTDASVVPNRGGAGIWLGQRSARNTVVGNSVRGDTTTTGGKYNYEAEYGIAVGFHPNNSPVSGSGECALSGNVVSTVINTTQEMYLAQYAENYISGGSTYQAGLQIASIEAGNNAIVDNWTDTRSRVAFFKTASSDTDTIMVNSSGVRVTNGTNNVFFQAEENGSLIFAGDTVLTETNGDGWYVYQGNLNFYTTDPDTVYWTIGLRKNGFGVGRGYSNFHSTNDTIAYNASFGGMLELSSGDILSIFAKQLPGGNKYIIPLSAEINIWRIDE